MFNVVVAKLEEIGVVSVGSWYGRLQVKFKVAAVVVAIVGKMEGHWWLVGGV